jgi:hypothetical protein
VVMIFSSLQTVFGEDAAVAGAVASSTGATRLPYLPYNESGMNDTPEASNLRTNCCAN